MSSCREKSNKFIVMNINDEDEECISKYIANDQGKLITAKLLVDYLS